MGGCATCVRYSIFVANLVFVIAGAVLFGLGIAVVLNLKSVHELQGYIDFGILSVTAVTVMVVGAIVFTIAFFGCCGSIKRSNCMLSTYSVFMLLLTIVSIALAAVIFVNQELVNDTLVEGLSKAIGKEPAVLAPIEKSLKCCGINGSQFYLNYTLDANNTLVFKQTNQTEGAGHALPASCCEKATCDSNNAYDGCTVVLTRLIQPIGLILCAIACIQLLAAVLGLYVTKFMRDNSPRYW